MVHEDIFGTKIEVGDTVAFGLPKTYRMAVGVIIALNDKTVTVERTREGKDPYTGKIHKYKTQYYRSPEHIVVQRLVVAQGEDSAH